MRIILQGVLVLAAAALSGCSSPSTQSWAVATSHSRYLSEEHLAERVQPKTTPRASHDAQPSVGKTDNPKIYDFQLDHPAPTLPEDDTRKALRELDQHRAEEDRKVDAALAICRC
jgi:hypothetical protein